MGVFPPSPSGHLEPPPWKILLPFLLLEEEEDNKSCNIIIASPNKLSDNSVNVEKKGDCIERGFVQSNREEKEEEEKDDLNRYFSISVCGSFQHRRPPPASYT